MIRITSFVTPRTSKRVFLKSENLLFERSPLPDSYPFLEPLAYIEKGLAIAAVGFIQFHEEYKLRLAELALPPFSIGLRRAIDAIPELIDVRLRGWGWIFVRRPDAMKHIHQRLKAHEETKRYPCLDAALSWRLGKNVTRHEGADALADEAEALGIQPTMTPEEGEKSIWVRHRAWFICPALAAEIPKLSLEEHGRLANAVDELERLFKREIVPTPFASEPKCAEDWRSCGRQVETWRREHVGFWFAVAGSQMGRVRIPLDEAVGILTEGAA